MDIFFRVLTGIASFILGCIILYVISRIFWLVWYAPKMLSELERRVKRLENKEME